MELIFLPAFTLTLSEFSPAEVVRASALTQVVRQLFPAFGVATLATILQSRQAFHFSTIAQTVTPDSIGAIQALSSLENAASQLGVPLAVAKQNAVQVLSGMVEGQAAVAALNDVFLIIAFMALVALILSLFLRKSKTLKTEQPAGATTTPEIAD